MGLGAQIMSTVPAKLGNTRLAEDPRQTFEAAIAQIHGSGKPAIPSRTPIVVRRQAAPSSLDTEKRALTDAARALAKLWNLSGTLVR
jgi:hypothetical protein